MKKEDFYDARQGTGSSETEGENRSQQKNKTKHISDNQRSDINHQAGLGRYRVTDVEDLQRIGGRNDNDDLSNEELNASNDQ